MKKHIFLYILLFILAFWWLYPYLYINIKNQPYHVIYSPENKYRLEYFDAPFAPFSFPYSLKGNSCTDWCPGYIQLIENKTDKLIADGFYAARIALSTPRWYTDTVSIVSLYQWKLPKGIIFKKNE